MLNRVKLNKIKKIIDKYSDILMFLLIGGNAPEEQLLEDYGIPKELKDIIGLMFKYGALGIIQPGEWNTISLEEVQQRAQEITLTPAQNKALEYIKLKAGNEITNLSNRINITVSNHLVSDQLYTKEGIREILHDDMYHKSIQETENDLKQYTQDWDRDWNRVVYTELWNAKIYGEATTIAEVHEEKEDTLVFKRPALDACKHCIKHYLEPDKKTPRIFKLIDLMSNGTNDGKRVADWKPVLGTMHPRCVCTLNTMPKGFVFDSNGQLQFQDESLSKGDSGNLQYKQRTITRDGQTFTQGYWVAGSSSKNPSDSPKQEGTTSKPKQKELEQRPVDNKPKESNIAGLNQHTSAKPINPSVTGTGSATGSLPQAQGLDWNYLSSATKAYFGAISSAGFEYKEFSNQLKSGGRKSALEYLKSKGFKIDEKSTADDTWHNALSSVTTYLSVNQP